MNRRRPRRRAAPPEHRFPLGRPLAMMALAVSMAACPDGRGRDHPRAAPPAAVAAVQAPGEATRADHGRPTPQLPAKEADAWHGELETWRAVPLREGDYTPSGETESLWMKARAAGDDRRPVAFAFWATYCPPCLQEIPMFDQLFEEGHTIVGVSLDSGNEEDVKTVLRRFEPHYPQLVLDQASLRSAARMLKGGLPFTLVTDREGRPRYGLPGQSDRPRVLAALRRAKQP